jgi:hypothetical protein
MIDSPEQHPQIGVPSDECQRDTTDPLANVPKMEYQSHERNRQAALAPTAKTRMCHSEDTHVPIAKMRIGSRWVAAHTPGEPEPARASAGERQELIGKRAQNVERSAA